MIRIVFFGLGMLLLIGSAGAETYRCKDARGAIVFTDDPSAYAGCEKITVQEPPSVPVVLPEEHSAAKSPEAKEQPAAAPAAPGQDLAQEDYAFYLSQATALVAEFEETQKKAVNAHLHREKIDARRNLGDIRQRKIQLLEKLKSAGLSVAEDEEIKNILAQITAEK